MFTYTHKQLPKHTKEFLVEIAWDTIVTKREEAFDEMAKQIDAPGFRKGKAPRDIAARHINPQKVYEQVVRNLLPDLYKELVEKEKLNPVTSPSVELTEAKENEPWKLTVQVAEIPEVKLNDYKKKISDVHKKASALKETDKKEEGSKPAKSAKKLADPTPAAETKETKNVATLSEVFTALLASTECEVPDLLVQEEVNRKLGQLVDDVRKVGLTLDKYLESKQTKLEDMKAQFTKDTDEMYKIEFILAKIAEEEKLLVDQKELDDVLASAKTDKEREVAQANLAWYETLLRKQKVIDFLNNL
ncbi:hypothetical protein KBB12_04330 [Candidatus Woesebacteria bacterium]|nr:hypothetical protein [Candidatus Woesebacteria bacterium]